MQWHTIVPRCLAPERSAKGICCKFQETEKCESRRNNTEYQNTEICAADWRKCEPCGSQVKDMGWSLLETAILEFWIESRNAREIIQTWLTLWGGYNEPVLLANAPRRNTHANKTNIAQRIATGGGVRAPGARHCGELLYNGSTLIVSAAIRAIYSPAARHFGELPYNGSTLIVSTAIGAIYLVYIVHDRTVHDTIYVSSGTLWCTDISRGVGIPHRCHLLFSAPPVAKQAVSQTVARVCNLGVGKNKTHGIRGLATGSKTWRHTPTVDLDRFRQCHQEWRTVYLCHNTLRGKHFWMRNGARSTGPQW